MIWLEDRIIVICKAKAIMEKKLYYWKQIFLVNIFATLV